MPTRHVAAQGDCISSIAARHGVLEATVWDDAANAALREKRQDPNVLLPGDVVVVPDKRPKSETVEPGRRHRFKRKGAPAALRLQLLEDEGPRANQAWVLFVGERRLSGTTDGDGVLEVRVPVGAHEGTLVIGPDDARYRLQFGALDPHDAPSGVARRLTNLGYYAGPLDVAANDALPEELAGALRAFQRDFELKPTGVADADTVTKLRDLHDVVGKLPPPSPVAEPTSEDAAVPPEARGYASDEAVAAAASALPDLDDDTLDGEEEPEAAP